MLRALMARDGAYDGIFFAGVRTTRIFCRPVCPARKPRAENVEFFASGRAALEAGYRPCRKCRPLDGGKRQPAWAERLAAWADRTPERRATDGELRGMGVDPVCARRYFKEHYGMTFHAYHRARRMDLALSEIRQGGDATGVAFDLGYESASGFRDAFKRVIGRPPAAARSLVLLQARQFETPLGAMLAVAGEKGLRLLEFVDRRALESELRALTVRAGATVVPGRNAALDAAERELGEYFASRLTRFTVPLDLAGSPFQRAVWSRLLAIPFGETQSYDGIARAIGRAGAQRAIGRANGQNTVAIVVPCHRVVRADGSLCGYGGGVWRKRWLLDHERSVRGGASGRLDLRT